MTTISFANRVGSDNQWSCDVLVDDEFTARLSARAEGGIHIFTLKDPETWRTLASREREGMASVDAVLSWARGEMNIAMLDLPADAIVADVESPAGDSAAVAWIPVDVSEVDEKIADDFGPLLAFGDAEHPPVKWERFGGHMWSLEPFAVSVKGDGRTVEHILMEVDSADELEAGCWMHLGGDR